MGRMDRKVALVGGNLGKIKDGTFEMGLGAYIAKDLANEGANVVVVDLEPGVAEACAKALGSDKIKGKDCDLLADRTFETKKFTNERGEEKTEVIWTKNPAETLVKDIAAEFGHLDALITNFDYYEQFKLENFTDELWVKMRDENLVPVFHLLGAVRDQFAEQVKKGGSMCKVVMLSNMAGKAGFSMGTVYSGLKGAIISGVKSMAKEFGRFANVNGIAMAPLSAKKMQGPKDRQKKQFIAGIVASEMSKIDIMPEHIVPMVTFLSSDAANAISGQNISIDGGLWLKVEM